MKHAQSKMLVVATALVTAVVLAAGCGSATAPATDPFVGTWHESSDPTSNAIIIAKTSDGYLLTIALPSANGSLPATRGGDTLSGTFGQAKLRFEAVYLPASGHLTWANSRTADGPLNKPTELTKTSDSTALPTPQPF